jgi:hypothetical protein
MKSAQNDLFPIDTGITFKVDDDALNGEGLSGIFSTASTRLPAAAFVPMSTPSVHPSTTNIRARNEARKLLSHVLLQLANRRKPPAVLDSFIHATYTREESSFGSLPLTKEVTKGIKLEMKADVISQSQEAASDDEQRPFSTDDTINLVIQLEDVLATSIAQGWQIFDEGLVAKSCFLPL